GGDRVEAGDHIISAVAGGREDRRRGRRLTVAGPDLIAGFVEDPDIIGETDRPDTADREVVTGAGSERNRVGVVVAAAFPPPVDRGADREAAGARGRVTMIVGDRQQRELVGGAAAMLRAGIIAAGLGGGEMRLMTRAPEAL